jgi:spore coat polysaccharide biosynthesis predicted glycosyltransferase SpsG/RimJ/RimL family protein N-acetyltransferase
MEGEIHFFADAHPDAGLGHVVRCTSLAHALKHRYKPIFWVTHPEWAQQVVPFEVRNLEHYGQTKAVWSVIDSYLDQPALWSKVRSQSRWLLLVDDGLQSYRGVDLILNPAAGGSVWKAYAGTGIPVLNGPAYALLRPDFLQPHSPAEMRRSTALVCFGGRDPRNLTQQVIQELSAIPTLEAITAVLGPASDAVSVEDPRVTVVRNLNAAEMAQRLREVQVAIVPASGLAYEAMASGCRVIAGCAVPNQQQLFAGLLEEQRILSAGSFKAGQVTAALSEGLAKGWPLPTTQPWDGLSPERLLAAIKAVEMPLEVRPARWDDSESLLRWANDPVTRQSSFHPEAIERHNHEQWLRKRLDHPDYHIVLGWVGTESVGSFRAERHAEGWVCSLVIAPEARGHGWATALVFKACHTLRQQHGLTGIIAYIKAENTASIKAFTRAGFTFVQETIQGNTPSFEYRWS